MDTQWLYSVTQVLSPEAFLGKSFPDIQIPDREIENSPFVWCKDQQPTTSQEEWLYENYVKSLNECCSSTSHMRFIDTRAATANTNSFEHKSSPDITGFLEDFANIKDNLKWVFPWYGKDFEIRECAAVLSKNDSTDWEELMSQEQKYVTQLYSFIQFAWTRTLCRHVFIGFCAGGDVRIGRASPTGFHLTEVIDLTSDPTWLIKILNAISNEPGVEYGVDKFFKPLGSIKPDMEIMKKAANFFNAYSGMNLDYSSIALCTPEEDKESYLCFLHPVYTECGISGRNTRCYLLISLFFVINGNDKTATKAYQSSLKMLKFSWINTSRMSEVDFYEILHQDTQTPYIPTILAQGTISGTQGNDSSGSGEEICQDRELRWLIMNEVGVSITRFKETKEMATAFRDVLSALIICREKRIMHRDISSNNVMINIATRRGLLIDFDNAVDLRNVSNSPDPTLTGTVEFLSIVRYDEVNHRFWHDAESLFWAFIWVTSRFARDISDGRGYAIQDRYNHESVTIFQETSTDGMQHLKKEWLIRYPDFSSSNEGLNYLLQTQSMVWKALYITFDSIQHVESIIASLEAVLQIGGSWHVYEDPFVYKKDAWSTVKRSLQSRLELIKHGRARAIPTNCWGTVQETDFSSIPELLAEIEANKIIKEPSFEDILEIYDEALALEWPENDEPFPFRNENLANRYVLDSSIPEVALSILSPSATKRTFEEANSQGDQTNAKQKRPKTATSKRET